MSDWRSKLTDKQIDRIIEIAAGMAEDWYFADSPNHEVVEQDRSWCPYNRRGLPGADPNGSCSFGCWEEPACHTSGPYPLTELHTLLAPTGLFDTSGGHTGGGAVSDEDVIQAFKNFLSWGVRPVTKDDPHPRRPVPPAWFAYAVGLTHWCPPKGEQ